MERKIIGLEKVNYVSKKTGQPVEGINLHTIGTSANVQGMAAERFFVSVRAEGIYPIVNNLKPDDVVDIQFNRFGNVDAIVPLSC